MPSMYLDNYDDYWITLESNTEPNQGFELLHEEKGPNGELRYLRFRACLQTFGQRNRNRRLWLSKWMKVMLAAKEVQELLRNGGVPGEPGHPVPDTGEVSMERILTIKPDHISHVVKEYIWKSDNWLDGIIETIDDGNGEGDKFRRRIQQKLPTSFSTRSVIPQRKNPDGTIDQLGPGRYVCSDCVFVPSHEEAYIDKSVPVKEVINKTKFETAMESFCYDTIMHSEKVNRILNNMQPAMETATMGKNGMVSVRTSEGIVGVYPELKYRNELADIMRSF